jgi:hypothetical protein
MLTPSSKSKLVVLQGATSHVCGSLRNLYVAATRLVRIEGRLNRGVCALDRAEN